MSPHNKAIEFCNEFFSERTLECLGLEPTQVANLYLLLQPRIHKLLKEYMQPSSERLQQIKEKIEQCLNQIPQKNCHTAPKTLNKIQHHKTTIPYDRVIAQISYNSKRISSKY